MSDLLARLKATQCCDIAINGLLGAAIEEIERLRAALEQIAEMQLLPHYARSHARAALERKP